MYIRFWSGGGGVIWKFFMFCMFHIGKFCKTVSLFHYNITNFQNIFQNPQQLSANLWAAVRARGCQFLGPAMQEEVLKLVLLALEDGSALSRKVKLSIDLLLYVVYYYINSFIPCIHIFEMISVCFPSSVEWIKIDGFHFPIKK